jgi:3D-(3,5/4)-trihydroxycyclohexane-1,2-dione acylhydrolase (decyclizing)
LGAALGTWRADPRRNTRAHELRERWHASVARRTTPAAGVPSYAQVIGPVNRLCADADRVVAAAGGLPGEPAANWQANRTASVDIKLCGRKLIIVLCENGGFAVIDRRQRNTGNVSFNNLIADCNLPVKPFAVDFAAHARSMGANAEAVKTLPEFEQAFRRAKASDRAYLIDIKVDPYAWTEAGRAWWEVGSPGVSSRPEALVAGAEIDQGRKRQRRGV